MLYRLIAIDLDGTLLNPQGRVSERTRSAIHRVLDTGAIVCFATGRNWKESRPVFESVGHLSWAVTVGGAVVMDAAAGRIIHRRTMDGQLAAEVCRVLETGGNAVLALQDHEVSDVDYLVSDGLRMDASTEAWLEMTKTKGRRSSTLASEPHRHTLRISIVAPPAETAAALERLAENFGDRIMFHCIAVHDRPIEVLEIFDPQVNKWYGLQFVAEKFGIGSEEIIAAGDDVNDLAMLRAAGLGVAMGNGHPLAKAAAKRTIESNAVDGLAMFLEEMVETKQLGNSKMG
jgi:Cof subfamily protein (haloacid dehalogenase superfamily)